MSEQNQKTQLRVPDKPNHAGYYVIKAYQKAKSTVVRGRDGSPTYSMSWQTIHRSLFKDVRNQEALKLLATGEYIMEANDDD